MGLHLPSIISLPSDFEYSIDPLHEFLFTIIVCIRWTSHWQYGGLDRGCCCLHLCCLLHLCKLLSDLWVVAQDLLLAHCSLTTCKCRDQVLACPCKTNNLHTLVSTAGTKHPLESYLVEVLDSLPELALLQLNLGQSLISLQKCRQYTSSVDVSPSRTRGPVELPCRSAQVPTRVSTRAEKTKRCNLFKGCTTSLLKAEDCLCDQMRSDSWLKLNGLATV